MPARGKVWRALLGCRLCWKVTLAVFAGIVAIEALILVPSTVNYERDLLASMERAAFQSVRSVVAGRDQFVKADLERLVEATLIQGIRVGGDSGWRAGHAPEYVNDPETGLRVCVRR